MKMKKKLFSVFCSVLLLSMCVGCDDRVEVEIVQSTIDPASLTSEDIIEDYSSETSEEMSIEEPSEVKVEKPTKSADPYEVLEVSQEWASGRTAVCLLRNGKFYSLDCLNPSPSVREKNKDVGVLVSGSTDIYSQYENYRDDNGEHTTSFGPVPIMHYQPGDKIVAFWQSSVLPVSLEHVTFHGYSIGIYDIDYKLCVRSGEDMMREQLSHLSDFGVVDLNDNKIEDYHNLNYGQKYKFFWFEGTKYNEFETIADCSVYDSDSVMVYTIDGALTKEGYAEYDFSGVEPGTYMISNTGVVLIVD